MCIILECYSNLHPFLFSWLLFIVMGDFTYENFINPQYIVINFALRSQLFFLTKMKSKEKIFYITTYICCYQHSISLYRWSFAFHNIFFSLKKLILTLGGVHVCCLSERGFISSSFLNDIFTEYRILFWYVVCPLIF